MRFELWRVYFSFGFQRDMVVGSWSQENEQEYGVKKMNDNTNWRRAEGDNDVRFLRIATNDCQRRASMKLSVCLSKCAQQQKQGMSGTLEDEQLQAYTAIVATAGKASRSGLSMWLGA